MSTINVDVCPNQEADEMFVHPQVDSGQGFTVDAEVLPLLNYLWKHGIKTLCSCQGQKDIVDFGDQPHDHPAYVSVETLREATATYALLAPHCQDLVLEHVESSHGLSDEYVISSLDKAFLAIR